jgi:hypothetical protein
MAILVNGLIPVFDGTTLERWALSYPGKNVKGQEKKGGVVKRPTFLRRCYVWTRG